MKCDFSNDPEVLRCMYEASLVESGTRDTDYDTDRDDGRDGDAPHGFYCDCEACQWERAADAAEEYSHD